MTFRDLGINSPLCLPELGCLGSEFVVRGLRLLCNSYFFSGIAEIFYAIMIPVVEFLGYPTCREDCSHGVPEYFTPVASRRLFHSTGKV